jgi:phosphoglycerol transferase
MQSPIRKLTLSIFYYLFLILTVCFSFHIVSGFFTLDLHTPIADGGSDFLPIFYQIKSLINNDWFPFTGIHSQRLGFPFGADWNDYPMNHSLFYLIIRFLGIFSKDWAFVFNLYWLSTFVLTSLTFSYTLKKLKIRQDIAFVISILFSFMPFHFFRMGHIWLSSYFMVPLQILVLLRISDNVPVFFGKGKNSGTFWIRNEKKISTVAILMLSGWAGIYYVFFFCAIAFFVAIGIYFQKKSIRHLLSALALIGICFFSVLIDSIPTIVKNIRHGINIGGFNRSFVESEVYGLKLIQMYLPSIHHRMNELGSFAQRYNNEAPLITENHSSLLGIVGVLGLTLLIFILFTEKVPPLLKKIAKLNIASILIGTIGGFGTLFAYMISPSIRGYNRISVFIYAFSLICIAFILEKAFKKIPHLLSIGLLAAIGVFGIWDQTSDYFRFSPPVSSYIQYKNFFSSLEKQVGDSPVYQLPAVDFPDIASYNRMGEYEQLRGYLFTDKTKWSYGNTFGRFENAWLQNRSYQYSQEKFINEIASVGFKYIYVNRKGFSDNANQMVEVLSKILGKPILESENQDLVLFGFDEYLKSNNINYEKKGELLQLPAFSYGQGVFFNQTPYIGQIAKIPIPAHINIFNPSPKKQMVEITFTVTEFSTKTNRILISCSGRNISINTRELPASYSGKFELPPGGSKMVFDSPTHPMMTMNGFWIKKVEQ